MSRWFRHYAGMMRDDKLVRVSIRSKQTIERVLWVWGAILESAAEIDDNGRYDVDAAEIAYFLRADEADILAVLDALSDADRIASGFVVHWGDRQFQSDRSKDRVAAYRERERAKKNKVDVTETGSNGDVTLQKRHCNSPETETETDINNTNVLSSSGDDRPDLVLVKDEPSLKPEHVVEAWNDMAGRLNLSKVRRLSSARRRQLNARLREYPDVDDWTEAIAAIERSPFLQGHQSKTGWRADFDFLLQPSSFLKLIEGSYDRQSAA